MLFPKWNGKLKAAAPLKLDNIPHNNNIYRHMWELKYLFSRALLTFPSPRTASSPRGYIYAKDIAN